MTEINGQQWRAIGELQGDMRSVKDDVAEIKASQEAMAKDITAIKSATAIEKAEKRGGAKAYAAVAAAGGAGGGLIATALAKWPWLQHLISSTPR